ncbi:hypothetical protein H2200_004925 [Cladophialophora chaetospira]|uniref:Uncharacterized protein n=1 Tax=Cladophialophora chaetospira TaxID=386627 RepID=A0AA38XE07_9EURO|nr:hypothetical protein H2200_004925 [Cladophialophora chaetospira]
MAPLEETPAPTGRFLPASSSSSSTQNPAGLPTVRRNPFHGARSTQIPPSSFNATPRFQHATPRIRDEIQTSFEDEIDTPLPPRGHRAIDTRDVVDAVDDEEYTSPLVDRGDEAEQQSYHYTQSSPPQQRHRPSAHSSKRRKLLHTQVSTVEPITVSSPPDDENLDDEDHPLDVESLTSQSDLEDDLGLSVRRTMNSDSSRFAHFRALTTGLAEPPPAMKASFKTHEDIPPGQVAGGPALPEVFTPSRRRGKRDYMPGGGADMVRSWVLAIPAQESHSQSLSEEILCVNEAEQDSSGRFWIVKDKNGSQWLLPEQQEKPGGASRRSLTRICPGTQLVVKGQATKWNLDLYGARNMTVAAYWELVSPG